MVSINAANTLLDQHDEEQNATAVDSLVYEANFIDPEISMESDTDENQLNSTQPAGISGENEPVANVETSCLQIESIIGDVDAENSCGSNEHSYAREQGSNNSSELVDSFHVNSFEPNEKSTPKSTPKSTNEAKCDENIQQTPCQTSKKDHEKTNLPKEVQKRAVSGFFYQISKCSNRIQTFMLSIPAKSTRKHH